MIVQSTAEDIVYSSLFTGVLGQLPQRLGAQCRDGPDNLPLGDVTDMSFGSDRENQRHGSKYGALVRDWCGQSVGRPSAVAV